ncbi:Developmental regulator flbA [Fusarium oxysporum f. sp. cepae]|uniref:Developmental regulator flbA n=1 Tax=Fusarium oxysporum f. sp. cepae TaxID=396571 RepID=A0A3L6NLL2_FUSOX|nr:Developmental regulator flbA [Fusarium oxysporum f. sp. cepae]RKK62170.1 Developmental regulator flbA [Fusarium oxysporum f. sp. cepae]RKK64458.1 Developmental regulator flbA [Fusarium oxysporum f. sp. cepae]
MATLSQHQRPTVHSASPSDTPLALDRDQDQDTTTNTPRSSISDRSPLPTPLPLPLPPAHINTSATSGNSLTSTSTSNTNQPAYVPYHPQHSHHRHTASSVSRLNNRSSTSLFALAASAFDRTQNAIAAISEPAIRPRQSSGALSRLSLLTSSSPSSEPSSPDKYHRLRSSSNQSLSSGAYLDSKVAPQTLQANNPPSQPYTSTDPNLPPPIKSSTANKMHQTSSRLLRMTDDDRPFTKDFKDLFSTLVVSLLPLSAHRVRLTKVEYTFLSEDAINNLGSLKFSQSNRMPDPKDPSRIVTTTTTTTFSMAKDMARSICQRFLEARFIESADGKYQQVYTMKGSVWQLTPKGITVLDRFCARNGIQQKQVSELANLASTQLVLLERDPQTDKLLHDQGTIEVIFRRFAGSEGRNIKTTVNAADSDSLHDYRDGLTGVKMAAERKVNGKTYRDTFTGKAATDWLMDCSTIVDKRETVEVATLFVEYELMEPVAQDRAYMSQNPGCNLFQPTKYAIYQLSQRGKDLVSGAASRGRPSESEGGAASQRNGITRDSNTQRLDKILNDPALRLLFREQLRDTHCEENLSFYQDVDEFVRSCKAATRAAQKSPNTNAMDGIKEIMASAYGIYNAFLAPGSPCELNIDHQLRNNLATRMTKAVGQDVAMIDTLQEVTSLFEDAQNAVFKLMASDSVPKFLRSPKYEQQLRNYEFDVVGRGPERSQSRSNRK